ncbi:MAG: alpha/beta hydrolase [Bacteriovoracia bacterium]
MLKILMLTLLAGCSSLFYYPDRILYVQPERYNFTYEEITFHPQDGTELIGWFFPAKTKNVLGTVVQFHGNAQNMSAHFLTLSWIMDRGYNLFVFDYRGYGISDGSPDPDGVYQDSLAALEKGRDLWSKNGKGKFIIYGQSLGGAIAMKALEDYKDSSLVDLVVQESTFMSYQDIGFHKLKYSLLFPFSPLSYVLVSDKYATTKFVKRLTRPTLVIVAENDKVVDPKFGKEIYQTLTTPKKWFWNIPKTGHLEVYHDPKKPYRDDFIKLLESLDHTSQELSKSLD